MFCAISLAALISKIFAPHLLNFCIFCKIADGRLSLLKKGFALNEDLTKGQAMKKAVENLICILFAAFAVNTAWAGVGYNSAIMGNERVLLINNWKKPISEYISIEIKNQGVYDINTMADFYWIHDGTIVFSDPNLGPGTNHVMCTKGGDRLWVLNNCRLGMPSGIGRNWIPCSANSMKSVPPLVTQYTPEMEPTAGIIMRNNLSASVMSPYYKEGVGTIYFDVVNMLSPDTSKPTIVLEFATNVTEQAKNMGLSLFDDVQASDVDWNIISFDVSTVKYGAISDTSYAVTNLLLDAPANSASNFFYRVKSCVNYREGARFRIRRISKDPTENQTDDAVGLILIDNVVASYPPKSIELKLDGYFSDSSADKTSVIGRIGDFSTPFMNRDQTNIFFYARYVALTNSFMNGNPQLTKATFHYRWRYLTQMFEPSSDDWYGVNLDIDENSNRLALSHKLEEKFNVGDLEYYITGEVTSIYCDPEDFAFDTKVGWGSDWTEAITVVTNRLELAEGETLPSCGTDYFTRIREGVSDYEYVEWNGTSIVGGKTNNVSAKMELIGDRMWRYSHYVSTNDIGCVLKFHFSGKKLVKGVDGISYIAETNSWFGTSAEVPYIPYTSVGVVGGTIEQAITLDDVGTHLVFEFNDELHSYSISHGTYQNFNLWTDAVDGFRGNSFANEANKDITDTGVSDRKKKYNADFYSWQVSTGTSALWKEAFNVTTEDEGFPLNKMFEDSRTPNGWTARNGMYTVATRSSDSTLAFQMQGRGQGSLSLDKLSAGSMPQGVGNVTFSARLSQSYDLEDFAYYLDGTSLSDYGISAKVIMSHLYDTSKKSNPSDMSTVDPCVSLLGYYRAGKGAYEFRITRAAENELTANLYKWTLAGGKLTSTCVATNKTAFKSHLLVPTSATSTNSFASAAMFIYKANSGDVKISCYLSSELNTKAINEDTGKLVKLIEYTDTNPLVKGTYGVGAKDCLARFASIKYHTIDPGTGDPNWAGQNALFNADDWNFEASGRWRRETHNAVYGSSTLYAQMPDTQTIELQVSSANDDDSSWKSIGWITNITSFATNRYEFTPCLSSTYYIRLKAGGAYEDVARTDVVINEAEVTAWRGETPSNIDNNYGQYTNWVYTASWIESAGEVTGGGEFEVKPVGTNEYVFIFKQNSSELNRKSNVDIYFNPKMDITISSILLVGGKGGGLEQQLNKTVLPGTNIFIRVGNTNASPALSEFRIMSESKTYKSSGSGDYTSSIEGEEKTYKAGTGLVIMRVKSASNVCTLQPARGYRDSAGEVYPISIRSPYLDDGMSTFSFSYINAHSNAVLWLQIATNTSANMSYSPLSIWTHKTAYDSSTWTTVAVFNFTNQNELAEGTKVHFMSLREHLVYGQMETVRGAMRLVVAPEVIEAYLDNEDTHKDPNYGKVTITRVYCCNEPPLDLRSWWGWNLHTEGWNTDTKEYAYINDSPDGLSCMLNFSALEKDNNHADAMGIGLGETDPADVARYAENNPFVQSPQITNGVGNVSFRARLFDTNQAPAEVVLYASSSPRSYQPEEPGAWTRVTNFIVEAATYKTYSWKSSSDSTGYTSIRLEVPGARHGRSPGNADAWEKPSISKLNRVIVDEVLVSEPIIPRLQFRDVRPFRTGLNAEKPSIITNIASMEEQPIVGESWGIQAEVEPQQMGDDLDTDSMKVYAACFVGTDPWGYRNWKDNDKAEVFELARVDDPNRFVFRSSYEIPNSIRAPVENPNTCIQYYVWVEFKDKYGESHVHELETSEWSKPAWYWPQDYNRDFGQGLVEKFSAYTIFDTISPRRAWINELDYVEYDSKGTADSTKQFIELAIPQNASIKGWYINALCRDTRGANAKWRIAMFGYGNAKVDSKIGGVFGTDYTNNYTFISLRSPRTANANNVSNADGIWTDTPNNSSYMPGGRLYDYEPYGFELVRPSGIVEHQVVVQGTNIWGSGSFGSQFTGEALATNLANVDGAGSTWFAAGEDVGGNSSIGVFLSHGEDASCWTNYMKETASKVNVLKDGTMQTVPSSWFLLPNGTNMWVYAFITGAHIRQNVGKGLTTDNAVIILPYGSSTSIVYNVDNWYRVESCTVNGEEKISAGDNTDRTWTLNLSNITNTTEVYASAGSSSVVGDKISRTDPYYPAVMDWLQRNYDDDTEIHLAKFMNLADQVVTNLTLRSMYWLNINPTEEGWALKGGMGHGNSGDHSHVVDYVIKSNLVDNTWEYVSNIIVQVTMMITNTTEDTTSANYGRAYAPNCMQGLEIGSNSSDYKPYAENSSNWTSVTFKVTGALQKPGLGNTYIPLRWFVFGPDSFDEDFTAKIEVADPFSKSSPAYNAAGWDLYRDERPTIFYRWRLDDTPPGLNRTEMLKADSTYK